jgi:hypothetical protein
MAMDESKSVKQIFPITPEQEKMVENVRQLFGGVDSIPIEAGQRLIDLLEDAPDPALYELVKHKVKFCHHISRRILKDRGYADA